MYDPFPTFVPRAEHHRVLSLDLFEALEERVRKLEGLLPVDNPRRDDHADSATDLRNSTDSSCVNGVDHSQQITSQPHKALDLFLDVKEFINRKVGNPEHVRVLKSLRTSFPRSKPYQLKYNFQRHELGANMIAALPSQATCDLNVRSFLDFSETLHPIFDYTHFMESYDQYWKLVVDDRIESAFTPCLLMISILASTIDDEEPVTECNPAFDMVTAWCLECDDKQARSLIALQIQTLHLIGMQLHLACHPDKVYVATGNLVRSARIAGLPHGRATSDVQAGAPHVQSLLWATIVELDLQSSLASGHPPAVPGRETFTHPVLEGETDYLPDNLRESLSLRLEYAHLLNNRDISSVIENLATLDKLQTRSAAKFWSSRPFTRVLYRTYIHRSIVGLSIPFLKGSRDKAHAILLKSSLRVLYELKTLPRGSWDVYHKSFAPEILQAIQIISFIRRSYSSQFINAIFLDRRKDGFSSRFGVTDILSVAEEALDDLVKTGSPTFIGNRIKDLIALSVIVAGSWCKDKLVSQMTMDAVYHATIDKLSQRAPLAPSMPIPTDVTERLGVLDESGAEFSFDDVLDFDFGLALSQDWNIDGTNFSFDNTT